MNVSNLTFSGDVSLSTNFLEASARAIAVKKALDLEHLLCLFYCSLSWQAIF